MKKAILNELFAEYCKNNNATIQESGFKDGVYVGAKPGTLHLKQSDVRAGNRWAIARTGEHGTVSIVYGFVYFDGCLSIIK